MMDNWHKWGTKGLLLAALGLWTTLSGQEPVATRKDRTPPVDPMAEFLGTARKAEPWLGVTISKPARAMYAQLPKVPRGTGFVVDALSSDGPAMLAGLTQYDFLWKMNDQLLVNEAQFLALLELQEVGDTVRLTFFRGGENHEVEAVLQARPEGEKGRDLADQRVLSPPLPENPRIVIVPHRTAELRQGNETVRISRLKDEYEWVVFDEFGLELDGGRIPVGDDGDIPGEIDKSLRCKLKALIRSYEDAERRNDQGPRVRRLPTTNSRKSQ